MLSIGEKVGAPFLALQRITGHSVERQTIDRYLVIDLEYIQPFVLQIEQRLLELMESNVEEWQKMDAEPSADEDSAEQIEAW